MNTVKFYSGQSVPLEMHKVRVVQKLTLLPVEERLQAMQEAGFNTFLLKNKDVFLDMLTDSGVNAMSDRQQAAMMMADDSYAGSETFYRLEAALTDIFGTEHFLPAHQGRACENILARSFVKPNQTVLMNFHFTTTKAHITEVGGTVEELISDAGLEVNSDNPFKGNMDLTKLQDAFDRLGAEQIAFVRMEAGTNLIGGQPISMKNMREVSLFCKNNQLISVLDASLLADNLYFIKTREAEFRDTPIIDITREIASLFDITYFSARKLGCARGGGIITSNRALYETMRPLIPLFEGFLTYGGMSVREMEALRVGLYETLDFHVIEQTPIFIAELSRQLMAAGVPVVTPAGGLGCHIDASRFLDHLPQDAYPSGALAAAVFIASGVRGMERGTMSEQRNADGSEHFANMELLRLALPKRVFTLSQVSYVADRLIWLHKHRDLIGGLAFVEEPKVLRFFTGRLAPIGTWAEELAAAFREEFPDSL